MTCRGMFHAMPRDIEGRRSCFDKQHAHARDALCGHLGVLHPSRESAVVSHALCQDDIHGVFRDACGDYIAEQRLTKR